MATDVEFFLAKKTFIGIFIISIDLEWGENLLKNILLVSSAQVGDIMRDWCGQMLAYTRMPMSHSILPELLSKYNFLTIFLVWLVEASDATRVQQKSAHFQQNAWRCCRHRIPSKLSNVRWWNPQCDNKNVCQFTPRICDVNETFR